MRPVVVTVSSATTSAPIPINWRLPGHFSVGIGCVATGTATYKVQHTFDDLFNPLITPTWFDNTEGSQVNVNQDFNYAFPITGVRLNVTAWTSGTVTMTVISGG